MEIDLYEYDGLNVHIVDTDGEEYNGVAEVSEDETTGKTCVMIELPDIYALLFPEDIKTITIVDSLYNN